MPASSAHSLLELPTRSPSMHRFPYSTLTTRILAFAALVAAGCSSGGDSNEQADVVSHTLSDIGPGDPDVLADVGPADADVLAEVGPADATLDAIEPEQDASPDLRDPSCVATLAVTTFNIRFAGFSGDNAWYALPVARRDLVLQSMRSIDADVFGLQEVLYVQSVDIQAEFDDYHFVGAGRDDGGIAGEFAAILLRAARFDVLDEGHFWMSETPDEPGTVFEGSGAVRMSSWAVVWDSVSERELLFLNTHWDHRSSASREASAELTRARLPALADGRAVVLTGDLNARPDDAALATMLAGEPDTETQLFDAYRAANPEEVSDEATFHGFDGGTTGRRIDYVLNTSELQARSGIIQRGSIDGAYPSDHFPVSVEFGWTSADDGVPCP